VSTHVHRAHVLNVVIIFLGNLDVVFFGFQLEYIRQEAILSILLSSRASTTPQLLLGTVLSLALSKGNSDIDIFTALHLLDLNVFGFIPEGVALARAAQFERMFLMGLPCMHDFSTNDRN